MLEATKVVRIVGHTGFTILSQLNGLRTKIDYHFIFKQTASPTQFSREQLY